ncbi:MAG: ABC transporter ATP-binding protein [Gemmatimonadota bacterium]|nr:MAG: ABC transporter ATP-binding protein [Gemmatimonadota bacterium]
MISVQGLSKRFGRASVLDGIELAVERRERVAVLGLNGAGKTTLIRCLMGLTGFSGTIEVAGHDVRRRGREARARLGYVPQRAPHFDGTLVEVVDFFCRLRGVDPGAAHQRLAELGLGMAEHGGKPVRALSGGMLQKSLLALALAEDVPLLLLDEPTANLDPRARREFLRMLRRVDDDTTILLATHRLSDVEEVADRLLVLHEGRIVFDGGVRELWAEAGASVILWVKVGAGERERAHQELARHWQGATVLANGSQLGLKVERGRRADVLVALREAELSVEDFWTETPSLHDLMERLLGSGQRSPDLGGRD